jgi:hypothetical protein
METSEARKVLVVEDESIVAKDIEVTLTNLGYAVTGVAGSGEEALGKIAEQSPDLVLMDIVLKGEMDGIATANEIRRRHHVPVVYLTAYADDETLRRAKVTEPFGYVLKPYEERELLTTIEVALYKHQMEEKVLESERRLATTLKSISQAVLSTNADGEITFMNPVAEAITGWPATEVLGRDSGQVFRIIDGESPVAVESPIAIALRGGAAVHLGDHLLVARDGKETHICYSAAPIRTDQGAITGMVIIFQDMSEYRQLQAQLARTERLRALGVMVGGVAHNFNNLLTAVLGHAQLLQMRAPDAPIADGLTSIESAVEAGAHLVRRLLEFADNRWEGQREVVDCNRVVHDALETTRWRWELRSDPGAPPVQVKIDLGVEVTVLGSLHDLSQALANVITNALEAMEAGGQLTIKTQREGTKVGLMVQDTGVGMDEYTRKHAFDPLFSTKGTVGVGLGLTQAFQIIERHDGRIELLSAPGRGTTVTITLPHAIPTARHDQEP